MAISLTHYQLLKLLKERGQLPQGGRILEIGKANWYGDAPTRIVDVLLSDDANGFDVAKRLYDLMCQPTAITAIDMDPHAGDAIRTDMNTLVVHLVGELNCGWASLVINHGTAEHIFNIANVFKVMHDACEVGGLMIHESPFTGWVDHGFYCLQPTLFYDLARENGYEMVMVAMEHLRSRSYIEFTAREQILEMRRQEQLPDDAMLFVSMRKVSEGLFKIPTQGIYSGEASETVRRAWQELR